MAKAKKKLFSPAKSESKNASPTKEENVKNKETIEKLIQEVKKRLDKPEDAQKAALIIEQWLHELEDQKQKKKSA